MDTPLIGSTIGAVAVGAMLGEYFGQPASLICGIATGVAWVLFFKWRTKASS